MFLKCIKSANPNQSSGSAKMTQSSYTEIKESINFSIYYHSSFFNTVHDGNLVLVFITSRRKSVMRIYSTLVWKFQYFIKKTLKTLNPQVNQLNFTDNQKYYFHQSYKSALQNPCIYNASCKISSYAMCLLLIHTLYVGCVISDRSVLRI